VLLSGLTSQVAVVIPCLNEGRTIFSLVSEVRRSLPKVMVVDDGSTDQTAAEAARAGAVVLRHSAPRGKGAALQSGFSAALQQGFKWALAMDGDGQHASSDIPRFLASAAKTTAAMIIGNRMQNPGAMPLVRRMVNRCLSDLLGSYCETSLPDSQCGFRLVNLRSWQQLRFSAQHFEIESELVVRFIKSGYRLDFVPIECRYASERSKIRPLRDTIRWIRWWKAIRKEMGSGRAPKGARHEPGPTPCESHFAPTPQDATA
jgi:glycosyltransferase involved in cell wall biosynthesis